MQGGADSGRPSRFAIKDRVARVLLRRCCAGPNILGASGRTARTSTTSTWMLRETPSGAPTFAMGSKSFCAPMQLRTVLCRSCHERCILAHNVNRHAVMGSPQCADFGGAWRARMFGTPDHKIVLRVCASFDIDQKSCEREFCMFVHNVNANWRPTRVLHICADFVQRGCSRDNCRFLHNVNPRAGRSPA